MRGEFSYDVLAVFFEEDNIPEKEVKILISEIEYVVNGN
jgi:hypothetical protein